MVHDGRLLAGPWKHCGTRKAVQLPLEVLASLWSIQSPEVMILPTLFHNGTIHTLDDGRTVQALLVDGERISGVGSVDALHGDPTVTMVDLQGGTVVPGFVDSHTHFLSYCYMQVGVDLTEAASLEEALELTSGLAARTPANEWIRGGGWNKNLWGDGGFPHRRDLDRVTRDHPVALRSKDAHALWTNTEALRRAGLDSRIQSPPGGEVLYDGDGEPMGIFLETAMSLVDDAMPEPSTEELKRVVLDGQGEAHSLGLTGLVSCEGADALRVFTELNREESLSLRIRMTMPAESLDALERLGITRGLGDEMLRISAVKIMVDGALGPQTAYMFDPYCGREEDGYRGLLLMDPEEFRNQVERSFGLSMPVAVHAIGDAANSLVLDVISELQDGSVDRSRIEHAQVLRPGDIERFAGLGVIASVQPTHAVADRDLVDRYWGSRGRYAYAFRSLMNAGVVLAFGSDLPVDVMDPLVGLRAAVHRGKDGGDCSWYPEERLSPEEAVRAHTWGSCYALGEEDRRGTLAPGMLADFVVLSHDIMAGGLDECRVEMTVVGGEVVYDRRETESTS